MRPLLTALPCPALPHSRRPGDGGAAAERDGAGRQGRHAELPRGRLPHPQRHLGLHGYVYVVHREQGQLAGHHPSGQPNHSTAPAAEAPAAGHLMLGRLAANANVIVLVIPLAQHVHCHLIVVIALIF